jgi:hypothetical protein
VEKAFDATGFLEKLVERNKLLGLPFYMATDADGRLSRVLFVLEGGLQAYVRSGGENAKRSRKKGTSLDLACNAPARSFGLARSAPLRPARTTRRAAAAHVSSKRARGCMEDRVLRGSRPWPRPPLPRVATVATGCHALPRRCHALPAAATRFLRLQRLSQRCHTPAQ